MVRGKSLALVKFICGLAAHEIFPARKNLSSDKIFDMKVFTQC